MLLRIHPDSGPLMMPDTQIAVMKIDVTRARRAAGNQ